MSQADLLRWRLRAPAGEPALRHLGQAYHAVATLDGVTATLDQAGQRLLIEAPASAFFATALSETAPPLPVPVRSGNGGFINYELFAQRTADRTDASAAAEFGVFTPVGVGVASFLASRIGGVESVTRLETTWTLDLPERRTSLRVGDAVTLPASGWGRSTRFGGIQYAHQLRDPALPADDAAAARQRRGGAAVEVDIFVNKLADLEPVGAAGPVLRQRAARRHRPGRDAGGGARPVRPRTGGDAAVLRQHVIAAATAERVSRSRADQIRTNYAQPGEQYGRQFGAGTYRLGLNDRFTAEAHAEAAEGGQVTAGLSGVQLLPAVGVVSAAAALSHSKAGNGQLLGLGFERNNINALSVGAARPVGVARVHADRPGTRRTGAAAAGSPPAPACSPAGTRLVRRGLCATGLLRPRARRIRFGQLRHQPRPAGLPEPVAAKALAGDRAQSLFATVTMPFGERSSASVTAQRSTSAGQPTPGADRAGAARPAHG